MSMEEKTLRIDPTVYSGRPSDKRSDVEEAIYDRLDKLGIPFQRVDHELADNMDKCLEVEEVLGHEICKNLLLTNRQMTRYYMCLMPGQKPFRTKHFSKRVNSSRLSFAGEDKLAEFLRTQPGSLSALELIFDTQKRVQLVIDRELLEDELISGHPGIATSTLTLSMKDMIRYAEDCGHPPVFIDLACD